jgi:serine/threonine-protein kinase
VYAASTGIRAVAFDLDRLEVRGDPVEVQPGVVTKESGAADFAVSENGTLVYMPGQYYSLAETLAWREPDGRETPLRVPAQPFTSLRISPDGRQAVAGVGRATSSGFWLIDLIRETSLRLTQDDMVITFPVWAPDGRQIAYGIAGRADAREPGGLFRLTVTGTGVPERLTTAPENSRHAPGGWTPDGRQLVFGEGGPRDADIKLLTHGSPPTVTTILGGPAVEWQPALSPDGRWLAYALIDSVSEVFVRPFPNVNDARIPVSAGPGGNPLWGPEGRELYFTRAGDVYVVTVEAGQPISFGKPKLLMALRSEGPEPIRVALPPVKGRVLKTVREVRTAARPTEYRVVLNWLEELKTRLPAR